MALRYDVVDSNGGSFVDARPKRYRAFISYSQRDKRIARRLHSALENYRIPSGVDAPVGADRGLGRFFRDDDEMGASQSLGAALEGALDDSENLIVLCSPAAAQSKWVDAEVRHFKSKGSGRIFAVIAAGEPNSGDLARECFPPSLKVKIDPHGNPTGEPDEPRAPDLQRVGLQRARVELAAGLLDIPFDALWQRDRRRALRNRLLVSAGSSAVVFALGLVGYGWLVARSDSRKQAANEAVTLARNAAADGRIGEALTRLAPFLEHRDTQVLVEAPLRALLGWIPEPSISAKGAGLIPARLRDATVLLEPGRGVYDVSDIGLKLERLIRSRDSQRVVSIGDQRVVVFAAKTGQRLAQIDNREVRWLGHAFEAPSGLMVVTGAILGPTNGSVWPFVLSISADGKVVERQQIQAPMFWGSAVGVTPKCDQLTVAVESESKRWRVEARELSSGRLGNPTELPPSPGAANVDGVAVLTRMGPAFQTREIFLGEAKRNPFAASGCPVPELDDGMAAEALALKGAQVETLEPVLGFEAIRRWSAASVAPAASLAAPKYLPDCTQARPCPVVGGQQGETFARDDLPVTAADRVGAPPTPRWARMTASIAAPIYFDHRVFNAGHQLVVCRPREGRDVCLRGAALGEDHWSLPFLRSSDGRFLYWPFGGSVYDLETLQPLTASRAVPLSEGTRYDFEMDRPGLVVKIEGRLVSFVGEQGGGNWMRTDDQRASPHFGILAAGAGEPPLHTLASLGNRQYLAVRSDAVLARLDAKIGREVWRITAAGLGEIYDVQLNPERRHVLVMGKKAWRLFGLADGFALSALLAPPPVQEQSTELTACSLRDVVGPAGQLAVQCGKAAFTWQPKMFTEQIEPRLSRLTCASDLRASALDTIRRCYVDR